MEIRKEGGLRGAGAPDEARLAKINAYARTPLTAEAVYCFRVRLCDDRPDRDFERFDTAALPRMAELFRGKTGICDHQWSADRQVARIFDTQVVREDDGASCLMAEAYVLRTERNADLIADIEGGIKKEVSVGCAMGQARCSICGEPYGTCAHRKGAVYDGETCLAVLSEPLDAYEFSFVAVPAQRAAGVTKAGKEGYGMTLQDCVAKHGLAGAFGRPGAGSRPRQSWAAPGESSSRTGLWRWGCRSTSGPRSRRSARRPPRWTTASCRRGSRTGPARRGALRRRAAADGGAGWFNR